MLRVVSLCLCLPAAVINMLWLVNSYCLDFLVSAVVNAVVTGALALGSLVVLVRKRAQVFDAKSNPFEAVGLLVREEEEADESSSDGGAGDLEERKEQHAASSDEQLSDVRLDELHAGAQVLREL